ncbi:MAG: hypothetical protein DRJ31_02115 [Candidatus Methanomethylicota archaeon]|uniref:Uncharacterized protein n=1 Tax=Thermoproteota archaeon TaxID=2056631 RepID=A0A497ESM8_9CREN|nr:MAG: hypothetical protein DRJ31_02115 [Candidatus Verstraetearchaeota archaeon]RLE51425.1 MAG: hypothetical protein DRJ33_05975 [Candidatus Verstraetearchaeota archaeon]
MSKSIGPDVKNLMKILLQNMSSYFSHDYLNSEGRKLFEEMARMLIYEHPEYKPIIQKTRRNPTLSNVLKIAHIVLGEEAEKLLSW